MEDGYAAFRAELGLAGVAGVEIKNLADGRRIFFMRVAKDDGVWLMPLNLRGEFFRRVVRVDDVVDEKFFSAERNDFCLPEVEAEIRVAEDGGDGRDEFQFQFNHRLADVARVQDVIHARKNFLHARVEETVGVGKDADF